MAQSQKNNRSKPANKTKDGLRTSNRGFASMQPAARLAAATAGGREAQRRGTAHRFTSEEARAAALKRTQNSKKARTAKKGQKNETTTKA